MHPESMPVDVLFIKNQSCLDLPKCHKLKVVYILFTIKVFGDSWFAFNYLKMRKLAEKSSI